MQKTSFAKQKLKFLLLEGIHPQTCDLLRADGYTNIDVHSLSLSPADLLALVPEVHFLGIRSRTQISVELLAAAKRLVAIGCFCIGTNQVDLKSAQQHGIPVFNAPYSNTRSVAELVIAEIVMLMRGIPEKNAQAHRGTWLKSANHAFEIRGKKLGIIGYGHIGTQLGLLAEAMGMQVAFYDIEQKLALGNAKACPDLQTLLAQSEVISLHVPATAQTEMMMNSTTLAQMRPGSWLINASRGSIVDIDALAQALKSGHLQGAAIDVFPQEPKSNADPFTSALQSFDNVILTPHVGGSTQEAQCTIGAEVIQKLIKFSNNGSTMSAVNFPQVALPAHPGKARLLHIHRNTPGMLSQINDIFSTNHINIAGQYLQTQGEIGYVVIDLDSQASKLAHEKLQAIPGTLKTRVLYATS